MVQALQSHHNQGMGQNNNIGSILDQINDIEEKSKTTRREAHQSQQVPAANKADFPEPDYQQKRAPSSVVEKRKMQIEIQIGTAHVNVKEPRDLQIEWCRHGKSVKSKTHTVDKNIIEPVFKDRFSMISGMRYDTTTQTFMPDISEITLFCENRKVGSCAIDLVQYIDAESKIEKVVIADPAAAHNALGHKVLLGDQNTYPGAFITFKIKVDHCFELQTPSSSIRYNQLSRKSSSTNRQSINHAFQSQERKEKMNLTIDALKLRYQPKISQKAEHLEELKKKHAELIVKKHALEEKMTSVDKTSPIYVVHQIDNCRGQIAHLSETLTTKKDYSKRLAAKLAAYKEIAEIIDKVGGGEEKLDEMLIKQEQETQKIEDDLRNDHSTKVQATMFAFDDFDDY